MAAEPFLKLSRLRKRFGDVVAVEELSLDIARGEALTLLGPSGCGKTTTLRMIAGLESPDDGAILLDGKPLFSREAGIELPPERRGMGMVFQSYAVWPHMTVAGNVGFPLRVRHVPASEVRTRVSRALAMVGLAGYEDRPAPALSGGQQQRVARWCTSRTSCCSTNRCRIST
jgi:iron(III) transport system ATP-binding protein